MLKSNLPEIYFQYKYRNKVNMGSVKNIIKTSLEKGEYGELHPLTYINKKETKLKKLTIIFLVITFLNLIVFIYISNFDIGNKKEKNKIKQSTSEENLKANIRLQPLKNIYINEDDLKYIVNYINKEKISNISFKNFKNNDKISKFDFFYKKAKYYEQKRDIVSSLYFYRKAYQLNPDYYILYKIALFNFRLKRYKATIRYSKKIISNVKNDNLLDKTYYLLYKSYEKLGKQRKSKLILEEAYYKLSNPNLVAKALGKIYLREKNLYAAAEIFENLAEGGNIKFAIKAGEIYEKLGENQMALNMYKKALELSNGEYKKWLKDKIKLLSN